MAENSFSQITAKRIELYGALAIGVLFFCLYVISASHTVILDYDDSAEFQTIAIVGGLPHQPYPLWCVIARVFALLPIGEPAFRATLLSIVFASVTLTIVFLFLFRRTRSLLISLGATASLGISASFWQNAIYCDVYAMNAALFVFTSWAAIRFYREPSSRRWLLFVLALGFLILNHTSNVAILPAALILAVWKGKQCFRGAAIRLSAASILVFLLPFTLYLYTYEIDKQSYPMNWIDDYGQYVHADRGGDPQELESFFGRMRFQMFSTRSTPDYSVSDWVGQFFRWCRLMAGWEFPFVGGALAFLGFFTLWVRDRRTALLATAVTVPVVILAIYLWEGAGMRRFANTVFVLFALYIAEGMVLFRAWSQRLRLPATPLLLALAALLLVLPPIRYATGASMEGGWHSRFYNLNASNDRGKHYGEKMAGLLPPNSLVFCRWSQTHVLFYFKHVKGEFEDVSIRHGLPRVEYMVDIIRSENPTGLYFTYPPSSLGFTIEELTPVISGLDLYKVSLPESEPIQ